MKLKISSNSITNWKDIENKKSLKCDFTMTRRAPENTCLQEFLGKRKSKSLERKNTKTFVFSSESDFALTIYRISGRNALNTEK